MTDFQLAMAVLAAIVLIFVLAWLAQARRPVVSGTPKERLDVIGDEVAEIKHNQAEIAKRQAKTDHDVSNIRQMIGALPSKDAVHKLEVDMATLAGKVELNNAVVLATSRTVDRIADHLMSKDLPS